MMTVAIWCFPRNCFQDFVLSTDNYIMGISDILRTVSAVLLNPAVIFITAMVILYLNFVNFVVRYRKKPPKMMKKKKAIVAAAPAAPAEGEAAGE